MRKNNIVIAGKYSGSNIDMIYNNLYIQTDRYNTLDLEKKNIESYKLIDKNSYKTISSRIIRGAIGRWLLGPVGFIIGVSMPKDKGAYLVSIKYHDGTESLIEVTQKYYNRLVESMC